MWQLIFSAGEPVSAFQPGRFFMARTDNMFGAYLSRPLFLAPDDDVDNGRTISRFQLTLSARHLTDRGLAWLFACPPGQQIETFGPLGHGFTLPPGAKNLLVPVDMEFIGDSLLGISLFTTRKTLNVTLTVPTKKPLPPALIRQFPPHVEITTTLTDKRLLWPDAIIAIGSLAFYRQLKNRLTATRLHLSSGLAQVFLSDAPVHICGVGACGLCGVPTTGGLRPACQAGPVFDLATLNLEALADD